MKEHNNASAFIIGGFIFLGLSALGYLLGNAAIDFKEYERVVKVKGLSEREYDADIVIWPIQFAEASNDLEQLYVKIESVKSKIQAFLETNGIESSEISFSFPAIIDKSAQQYGNNAKPEFRYTALQTVTVYSNNVSGVRSVMSALPELGKKGIVFTAGNYQTQTEYIFTRLNEVKPEMIEEATRKAREVARKFASDSQSALGACPALRATGPIPGSFRHLTRGSPHFLPGSVAPCRPLASSRSL